MSPQNGSWERETWRASTTRRTILPRNMRKIGGEDAEMGVGCETLVVLEDQSARDGHWHVSRGRAEGLKTRVD